MTLNEIKEKLSLEVLVKGDEKREARGGYCGDLLSWVMSRIERDDVWFTVMGNVNSVAVAVLSDCACIVLTENAPLDEAARMKAEANDITIFRSEKDAYSLSIEFSKLL